jgi:hypothetical protein
MHGARFPSANGLTALLGIRFFASGDPHAVQDED